jgi:hypothetical protein
MQIVYWCNELLTRQETDVTLKCVPITIVAVVKQYVLNFMSVCPYSCVSYPGRKRIFSAPYYIVVFCLSGSTIFSHTVS